MSEPQRRRLLTHSDLDGAAASVVARLADPLVQVVWCSYGASLAQAWADLVADLEAGELQEGWVADLSPAAPQLAQLRRDILLVDHHQHGAWAEQWRAGRGQSGAAYGSTWDPRRCGAQLLYLGLRRRLGQLETGVRGQLAHWLDVVAAWDLWLLGSPLRALAEAHQELVGILGLAEYADRCLGRLVEGVSPSRLDREEQLLVDCQRRQVARYVAQVVARAVKTQDADGRTYAAAVVCQHHHHVGQALLAWDGVQYVELVDPEAGAVRLRSSGQVDVGALAQARGGGGHPGAAGYPLRKGA